ncbi:hypothetical protein Hdeb2414_s0016g00471981 [Helianthus debilis subsp. tardiflorus]
MKWDFFFVVCVGEECSKIIGQYYPFPMFIRRVSLSLCLITQHPPLSSKQIVMGSDDAKRRSQSKRLGKFLKEQRGRLYIIKRCVVMLLCWND